MDATNTNREIQKIMHPLKVRLLTVKKVVQVSPRMKRITLTGKELSDFVSSSPDDHVKAFFPQPGEKLPVLPKITATGPVYPEGYKPIMRDYTPVRFDNQACELDLEFYLHESGPGTEWALQAQEGQALGIAGPRGSFVVPYKFDWYLMIGDETAIPSIHRRLQELPANAKALAIIEVEDISEERVLSTLANTEVIWVHRKGHAPGTADLFKKAILAHAFPYGDYFTWIATEGQTSKELTELLETVKGANTRWIKATAYWKKDLGHE